MTIRSERPLDISFAMSSGVVSHRVALRSEPSGSVTVTSSRGLAVRATSVDDQTYEEGLTLNRGVIFRLELIKELDTMIEKVWTRLKLFGVRGLVNWSNDAQRTSSGYWDAAGAFFSFFG